jgi:UDP-N-acetylmuramoyl-tripeptide--D-alanyl-D-alanine ligase
MSPSAFRATAREIADACCGRIVSGDPHAVAAGVQSDSRALQPGNAFFALRGERFDGHGFIPQAVEIGSRVIVVDNVPDGVHLPQSVAVVQVVETERAMLALAAWHRTRLGARVIAITGSYGKTTVKEMLGAMLSRCATCTTAPRSYNNRIGVALTLLSASPQDAFVVLEMGTNAPGEIDELARAARPHIGVITAIAAVHTEGLGSLEGVRDAKAELIPHLPGDGLLVLNADQALCQALGARFDGWVLTFGEQKKASVRVTHIDATPEGCTFETLANRFALRSPARYNALNAAAALCVAHELDVPAREARAALAVLAMPALRYEIRQLAGVRFVLDCYNSNPDALRTTVKSFVAEPAGGTRILVCGDMLELGAESARIHRKLGRELARSGLDMLVAVGPMAAHMLEGWDAVASAERAAVQFETAEDAWRPLQHMLQPGDAVLVKGSRRMKLEAIVERIAAAADSSQKEVA